MIDSLSRELKLLYHICFAKNGGQSHEQRMENYFGPQAEGYDSFRKRLLHGRAELYQQLPSPENGVWLELGGGTGQSLEFLGDRIHKLDKVYLVDLSPSLLEVAKERGKRNGWKNLVCVEADASSFAPPEKAVDVVTFTYSLSMIPSWIEALNHVNQILKPGGTLGVVDFYQARKHPVKQTHAKQGLIAKLFWHVFFQGDDVFPDKDHLPYMCSLLEETNTDFGKGKIPYLPLWAPYYTFQGVKSNVAGGPQ